MINQRTKIKASDYPFDAFYYYVVTIYGIKLEIMSYIRMIYNQAFLSDQDCKRAKSSFNSNNIQ